MKDMKAYAEKLRVQMSECENIRDRASDPAKRELFARIAAHFKVLADEIERVIDRPAPPTLPGRKAVETLPREED